VIELDLILRHLTDDFQAFVNFLKFRNCVSILLSSAERNGFFQAIYLKVLWQELPISKNSF